MQKIVFSKDCLRAVGQVVEEICYGAVSCRPRKATKYLDPKLVVKASARHRPLRSDLILETVVTIGRPNYEERKFIKMCLKAGEPFPIKKIQLKPWPDKKPRLKKRR